MSVADELQKLQELHAAGHLTDAELAAAKAKVLNGSSLSGVWPQASSEPLARQREENNWAVILHLSQLLEFTVIGYVVPFLIWLLMKDQYPGLDAHGKNVANWILSSLLWAVVCGVSLLIGIGLILFPVLFLLNVVFPIVGAVKASQGVIWKYPLTIEFFK